MNNQRGIIPIIALGLIAVAFIVGAKVQKKITQQTMICHEPSSTFTWPSMSVPDYDRR